MKYQFQMRLILINFLLLLHSNGIIYCETVNKTENIRVLQTDLFPHNIEKHFSLTVSHPEIEYHHLYALFVLQVNCLTDNDQQSLFIFPGFTNKLDHRLKETLFHIVHFETARFLTVIVVQFLRQSRGCEFSVEYSAKGADSVNKGEKPQDSFKFYSVRVLLFRPAKLRLSVVAEDGHEGGLSIGGRGTVTCKASDGFPQCSPKLSLNRVVEVVKEPGGHRVVEDRVVMHVVAARSDHGVKVTCTCGSVTKSVLIRVFHHADSVEIEPSKQNMFLQGSNIQCKSIGGGYPSPIVRWNVAHLNETSAQYFTITSTEFKSTIHINSFTPNHTQWSLNCSSYNIIPPLDRGGPSLVLNITIGKNVSSSIMMGSYFWIIGILVTIVIIVLAIVLVCASSYCRRPKSAKTLLKPEPQAPQYYLPTVKNDAGDQPECSFNKDVDCFV